MRQGFFITLEGGEGSGKSTQQKLLVQRLEQEGYSCFSTYEPGHTALGQKLRALLLHGDPISSLAELFLYAAERAEHVQRCIRPALAAGQVVVCDRFADSTLAYQGYGRGLDLDLVRQVNQWATDHLQPHLTLWLDVPPEVGLERVRSRRAAVLEDRLEGSPLDFHQRLHRGFQELAKAEPQRVVRIDAQGSVEEVAQRIWEVVRSRLAHWKAILG